MHTPDEWRRQYAARLVARGGCTELDAANAARVAFDEGYDDMDPEDAADEEMSNWDDDGDDHA